MSLTNRAGPPRTLRRTEARLKTVGEAEGARARPMLNLNTPLFVACICYCYVNGVLRESFTRRLRTLAPKTSQDATGMAFGTRILKCRAYCFLEWHWRGGFVNVP